MKVAIVCDWLLGIGGAERVVLDLHKLYPDAPIYTSQYDPSKIDWFKDADVRTTWLQKLPGGLKKFLPVLRALAFSRLDLSQYDLIISSTSAEAKAVKKGDALHVSYYHAPTHYYWVRYEEYLRTPGFGKLDWLARLGLKALVGPMKKWDYRAAQKPDVILTNSTHTATQVKKFYNRASTVVFPPVQTGRFKATAKNRYGLLAVGRQTPYKRIDLPVLAATELGVPLTVIGNGPDHEHLVSLAGPTVSFITDADDQAVAGAMETAEALVFPNVDDFGITAVEALAAGTPVIAFQAGGPLDYVQPGINGAFFEQQTVSSLVAAITQVQSTTYDPKTIRQTAERFSEVTFTKDLQAAIAAAVTAYTK